MLLLVSLPIVWAAVMLIVLGLCATAAAGDRALAAGYADRPLTR